MYSGERVLLASMGTFLRSIAVGNTAQMRP
jgi:hypothetical protein